MGLWPFAFLFFILILVGLQVVVELLLGLVLCMWAALTVPGKFLSIHPHSDENRYCWLSFCLHFVNWDFFVLD